MSTAVSMKKLISEHKRTGYYISDANRLLSTRSAL